ncbi:hypothetical protein ACIA5D_26640 [Actinoplanes sp. NPDC051513]|uniref:hypothetical protein n=1 Tax=Actinoplanes sp. NPDC051513 TaxID=3363908 RepID=UPI0037AD31DB
MSLTHALGLAGDNTFSWLPLLVLAAAAGTVMQLRQVLASPAVAEDETSQAHRAARDYAAVITSVGIDPTEAIRIIEAALGHAATP